MNAKVRLRNFGSLLLTMAALMVSLPAAAQTNGARQQPGLNQQAQNYTVLHVDAAGGNDLEGSGSVDSPYQTITQALQMATPGRSTVILLAPGHYSQASGEQFPLRLRPGITIQGNAGETRNTMIVGGGEFQDENITKAAAIVTSDRSGLANISVSNPKGNGIWISGGSPILRRVALVSNAVAGIQVIDGAPVIENSYFHRNRYGLDIQGDSRAVIRGNYFEAMGRAITIASPATPTINNNRIARNDVGIALKNNARPVLEANVLDGNGRNGVVEMEVATALAHEEPAVLTDLNAGIEVAARLSPAALEPADEPPGSDEDISGADTLEPQVSIETETVEAERDSTAEPVLEENTAPREILVQEALDEEPADPAVNERSLEVDGAIASYRQHLAVSSTTDLEEQPPILQQRPTKVPDHELAVEGEQSSENVIPIAVIPANATEAANPPSNEPRKAGISQLLARLNNQSAAAPVAETAPTPSQASAPPLLPANGQRLPVPSATIPSSSSTNHLTPPGTASLARAFRYRVLVEMGDADDLRSLVPDAFRTRIDSQTYMQAGAYVDEAEAQERLEWLEEHGIEGKIDLRN